MQRPIGLGRTFQVAQDQLGLAGRLRLGNRARHALLDAFFPHPGYFIIATIGLCDPFQLIDDCALGLLHLIAHIHGSQMIGAIAR